MHYVSKITNLSSKTSVNIKVERSVSCKQIIIPIPSVKKSILIIVGKKVIRYKKFGSNKNRPNNFSHSHKITKKQKDLKILVGKKYPA